MKRQTKSSFGAFLCLSFLLPGRVSLSSPPLLSAPGIYNCIHAPYHEGSDGVKHSLICMHSKGKYDA